jgi:hypothetical protein
LEAPAAAAARAVDLPERSPSCDDRLVGAPSYDPETLAAYFQPVHPELFADPRFGQVLSQLRDEDPDVILAVADVDRSQIRDALDRTPAERLRACHRMAEAFQGMRVVTG